MYNYNLAVLSVMFLCTSIIFMDVIMKKEHEQKLFQISKILMDKIV